MCMHVQGGLSSLSVLFIAKVSARHSYLKLQLQVINCESMTYYHSTSGLGLGLGLGLANYRALP